MKTLGKHRITSFQIIVLSFLGTILIGTLLLTLPVSSKQPGSASFSDCLFTATSAVCVTGLVVRDTATYWTFFGKIIIICLIQIGGLGVITAALALSVISGNKIGLMQRSVMQESISAPQVGGIVRLTRFFIAAAFGIELLGACLMLPVFIPEFGATRGIWYALFHSISAFCNAGFDMMGFREAFSSLTSYSENPLINIVLMLLIIIGGIGFLVWNDIKEHGFRWKQYRLQSKIVIVTSSILIVLPFLWFLLFEMEDLSFESRVLPSLFQSVTLRTAGFNTVDLSKMSDSGQSLMIVWMLIGGSPGSTAGGLKTTTVAVLLLTALSVFRRKDETTCFGRRIGEDAVRNAATIVLMYFLLFFISGMIISRIENIPLLTCLFETASAIGTVGLTLGITSTLGPVSRCILIVLMFLGRVGGLTLIYATQSVRKSPRSSLPIEKITVG